MARLDKYVPSRVRLRKEVQFRATNPNATIPNFTLRKGTQVNVIKVAGQNLILEYNGRQQTVPIIATDFLDQVIAEAAK